MRQHCRQHCSTGFCYLTSIAMGWATSVQIACWFALRNAMPHAPPHGAHRYDCCACDVRHMLRGHTPAALRIAPAAAAAGAAQSPGSRRPLRHRSASGAAAAAQQGSRRRQGRRPTACRGQSRAPRARAPAGSAPAVLLIHAVRIIAAAVRRNDMPCERKVLLYSAIPEPDQCLKIAT